MKHGNFLNINEVNMLYFEENMKVLFIGDSITDCGRNREKPEILGNGYANMVASLLNVEMAELNLSFQNFGISGNRVKDLKARWQTDCIDQKTDIVSILIGVNDVWRRYDSDDPTTAESFENDYRKILQDIRDNLNSQIIIIEPFLLPVPEDRIAWREDLDPKITAVRKLAYEFADAYVPMDGIFAAASCRCEHAFWAADGVHPTQAGHMLIAQAWMSSAL